MCAVLWLAAFDTASADRLAPIRIALKPTSTVPQSVVRIGQIAEVTGGDETTRQVIERIDIADPPARNRTGVVSRQHVEIRLRLAGFLPAACAVGGAESSTLVLEPEKSDDERILAVLHKPLAHQLSVEPDDLHVRLAGPLRQQLPSARQNAVRLEPVFSDNIAPGRADVKIRVYSDNRLVEVLSVAVDVLVFRRIPVTTTSIPRGATFTNKNVKFERRAISGRLFDSAASDVFGQVARRSIRQGDVIQTYDIDPRAAAAQSIVVKSRAIVRMSATRGKLKVIVSAGEALQPGKIGDYIRVRNMKSQNIVVGRVIGPSEVEVPF
jgi:flagella basal body P-ring formation protein FlgA